MTHGMTRRSFLAASAATMAALGAASAFGCANQPIEEDDIERSPLEPDDSKQDWVYSYCRNCIGPWCGIKVRRENGVAVQLEGDKDWPLSRGRLCPRGNMSLDTMYSPYLVKAPMKRTNPEKAIDNDPGWVEISWEEAIDTCVEKLTAVQQDDPNKLLVARGFGGIWDDMPMFRPMFGVAFGTASATEINGPLCPFHYGPLNVMGSFTSAPDLKRCNYAVAFGLNLGGTFARANAGGDCNYTCNALLESALDRGCKIIEIGPHAGGDTMREGTTWIPLRPGDDLPLMLALAEVIMCEGTTIDEEFVKFRSNFPYLIDDENQYLRNADGKPCVWDASAGAAVAFDAGAENVALEGEFESDGIKVRPAYQIVKEYISEWTPEKCSEMTGVPAEQIREIGKTLVEEARIGETIDIEGEEFPYRPACVCFGRGATAHKGGGYFMLAANIVNTLLGCIDVPGGILGGSGYGGFLMPGADGTIEPQMALTSHASEWIDSEFSYPTKSFDLTEYYPHRHSTPHVAWRSIVDPEKYHMAQDCEIIFIWGANPFVNNVNNDEVVEAFKKVPFVIDIAMTYDETSQFADILLAESSTLERYAFTQITCMDIEGDHRGTTGTNFRSPVVDVIHNTRTGGDMLAEIMNKMGMGPMMNGMFAGMTGIPEDSEITTAGPAEHTFKDMCEILLQALYGSDKTLDDCLKNGTHFVVKDVPENESYNYHYYPGRETRVTVWDDHLMQTGLRVKVACEENGITVPGWDMDEYLSYFQPYPRWIEHPEHNAPADYDLRLANWKVAGRSMAIGGVTMSGVLREIQAKTDPEIDTVILNVEDAEAKGLSEGDDVIVTSTNGKSLQGKLHVSGLLAKGCCGFAGNYGHKAPMMGEYATRGLNYNQLLSAEDGEFDPVTGGMEITAAVKVEKA